MIIWCSGNAAKALPPSAQHARTRLVLTHTWGFLTSSQMGRKGRLDIFFPLPMTAHSFSLSLSLSLSLNPLPLGSNFICQREIIRFKLCSCVKGLTQNRPCYSPVLAVFRVHLFLYFQFILYTLVYANYKRSCNMSNRFQI